MVKVDQAFDRSQYEAVGKKYVIASQGSATSQAAKAMFDKGGNIIDAAIAASFAVSVERPQSTGIGGGGFMLFYSAKEKKTYAIDFREKAPLKAHEKMFQDRHGKVIPEKSSTGIFSSGVPGLIAGLFEIKNRFGSNNVTWAETIHPSIELAEHGFVVYPELIEGINYKKDLLIKSEGLKKIYFKNGNSPLEVGDVLVQKDLADTLRTIARDGRDGFYKGKVAKAILKTSQGHGGYFTREDFEKYDVKYRKPIEEKIYGKKITSMPPPSSGGIHVVQILKILDGFDLKKYGPYSDETIHKVSSAMQLVFADRSFYLGDSDFVQVPISELLSEQHIQSLKSKIKDRAIASKDLYSPSLTKELTHTTHFSLMDEEGNVVTTTQTVNGSFGSGVLVPKTGIILNNQMDDFATKQGEANIYGVIGGIPNLVAPEKRPLSSMSPTILFDENDKPMLALGSPYGSRIITCVMLSILNYLEFDMPLFDSISAMRYHHQWYPEVIEVESPGFDNKTKKRLSLKGHTVVEKPSKCRVQAVENRNGALKAVSDVRGKGLTIGN